MQINELSIIMKVHIERNNFQLELIRYSKKMLILLKFTFAKLRLRPSERIARSFEHKPLRLLF